MLDNRKVTRNEQRFLVWSVGDLSAKGSTTSELQNLLLRVVSTPLQLQLVKENLRTPQATCFFRALLVCKQYSVPVLDRRCNMTPLFERLYRAQLAQLNKASGSPCTTLTVGEAANPLERAARDFLARLRLADAKLLALVQAELEATMRLYAKRANLSEAASTIYWAETRRTAAALFELGVPLRLGYGAGERYNMTARLLFQRRVREAFDAAKLAPDDRCIADAASRDAPPLLLPSDELAPRLVHVEQDGEPNPFE